MGSGVVRQRAERVGRRPRVAAGGRGAGRPSPRTRARRASVHGQGLGRRELEALRELLSPAAAAFPPDVSFPSGSRSLAELPNGLARILCVRSQPHRAGRART